MVDRISQWHPTPGLLHGKSHGRRSLVGCSLWGRWESHMTERLHFHFSLSCIREGNGNALQCSCLENPRDGGAWWAAIYGVAQSWTWLKRLSSSCSLVNNEYFLSCFLFYWLKVRIGNVQMREFLGGVCSHLCTHDGVRFWECCHQCLCPQPQPLLASLRDSPRQTESSQIGPFLGIHTTIWFGDNTWNGALSICRN